MHHRQTLLLLTSLILLLSGGCAINPASGLPHLVFMSEDKEITIGHGLHEKILESTPVYQDPQLQAYVETIGQKLAKNSDRADLRYTFTVIDHPDINAFALPGGYIYINRGLLAYLNSEAQLAAVLAHEIGHVTARHAVKQDTARKSSSAVTVLSVLTTGSGMVGDVTDLWGTAAVLGYGRDMELDADSLGARYLYSSGYNPNAMIEVIGVLKDHERFVRRLARETGHKSPTTYHGLFATHPRNDERLKEVVATAGKLTQVQSGADNRDAFRAATEGLLYGINDRPRATITAHSNTRSRSRSRSIHYVKANQYTTFKRLSEVVPLGNFAEQQLRLLNGYFPRGEPEPGDWIKIVR